MAASHIKKPVVASVVGTRPQFIKLAALSPVISKPTRHIIIFSGQHYDRGLSDILIRQLKIPGPNINLNAGSGPHGQQTGRMLMLCEKALLKSRPDLVLVYGDTNTTLAAALAAAKLGIPVAHIEAGLRSGRISMPEEINRKVTDHISSLLFYPTSTARRNLRAEGITRGLVLSGDLMYELLDNYQSAIDEMTRVVDDFGISRHKYIMATLHRPENVDNPDSLSRLIDLLRNIDDPILFLMHPRTRKNLKSFRLFGRISSIGNLIIAEPQAYLETLALIKWSKAVLTDSGGIQKETGYLGRPCLTLRGETEWVETVARGANFLVGLSIPKIKKILQHLPRIRKGKRFLIKGKRPSEIITTAVVDYIRKKT